MPPAMHERVPGTPRRSNTSAPLGKVGIFTALCLFFWGNRVSAQLVGPFAPFSPTESKQCEDFSRQVDSYEQYWTEQHEHCLSDNKVDRHEAAGSVCSRSACQSYHDRLYGEGVLAALSVKEFRKQVSACYANVSKYEAEEALKKKESDKLEGRRKEEERAESERRKRAEDERETRQRQREAERAKLEEEKRKKEEQSRQSAAVTAPPSPGFSAQRPSSQRQASTQRSKSSSGLVDPFKDSGKNSSKDVVVASNAISVDPFGAKDKLVDPFEGAESNAKSSDLQRAQFEASSRLIEASTEKAVSKLDKDIAYVKSQSGLTINRTQAEKSIAGMRDTQSVVRSLGRLVTGAQYTVLVKEVVSAETASARQDARADIAKSIALDTIRSDLAKEGMTSVASRMFGQNVGKLLVGGTSLTVEAGAILLDSERLDSNPAEVIRDTSGKITLEEKQTTLLNMWRNYEKHYEQSGRSNEAIKRELWINSNIVYNECREAKGSCDRWKELLNK